MSITTVIDTYDNIWAVGITLINIFVAEETKPKTMNPSALEALIAKSIADAIASYEADRIGKAGNKDDEEINKVAGVTKSTHQGCSYKESMDYKFKDIQSTIHTTHELLNQVIRQGETETKDTNNKRKREETSQNSLGHQPNKRLNTVNIYITIPKTK